MPWAILALGVVFFVRPLLLGWTFYFRDLHLAFLPALQLVADVWRQGTVPLWNPYLNGGQPLLGDPLAAGFYPATLLYLVLPHVRAFSLDLAGHVILAAIAAYALARTLSLSRPAAWATAMVYGFCGLTLSQLNGLGRLMGLPYLPLTLLALHRLLVTGERRWLALAGLCGGLQLLACAPEIAALTWVTALVWVAAFPYRERVLARAWKLGLAIALTVMVAAVQLLPTTEMTRDSRRSEGISYTGFTTWSVAWRQLPSLFVAGYLGPLDTLDPRGYWGTNVVDRGYPLQGSFYFGIAALALAGAALTSRSDGGIPRRVRVALLALALAGLLLACGRHLPGFAFLYRALPPLHAFRFPEKFLLAAVLPVALAAGWSVHRLGRPGATAVGRWAGGLAAGAGGVCLVGSLAVRAGAFDGRLPEWLLLRSEAFVAAGLARTLLVAGATALAFVLALVLLHLRRSRLLLAMLVAVISGDLLAAGRSVNPVTPADWFLAEPPVVPLVRATTGAGRFYHRLSPSRPIAAPAAADAAWGYRRDRFVLEDYLASAFRIPTIFHTDFLKLTPLRTSALAATVNALPWRQRMPLLSDAAVTALIAEAGLEVPGLEPVAPVADPGGAPLVLYRNRDAAPRFRWIGVWRSVPDAHAALGALLGRGFDPRRHAVIEDPSRPDGPRPCTTPGSVAASEPTFAHTIVEVRSACDGYLVIADTPAPGWRYRLDGVEATAVPADYAFAAVWVPAGTHRVERRYRPLAIEVGAVVSLVGVAALGWLARPRGSRRRRARWPAAASHGPSASGGARRP